ncbi:MAG: hypothetical protein LBK61_02255, partial [Spirochaetaceae bacterium]|nr:hypothetical protein [Spirochaetaceae bacterium]
FPAAPPSARLSGLNQPARRRKRLFYAISKFPPKPAAGEVRPEHCAAAGDSAVYPGGYSNDFS